MSEYSHLVTASILIEKGHRNDHLFLYSMCNAFACFWIVILCDSDLKISYPNIGRHVQKLLHVSTRKSTTTVKAWVSQFLFFDIPFQIHERIYLQLESSWNQRRWGNSISNQCRPNWVAMHSGPRCPDHCIVMSVYSAVWVIGSSLQMIACCETPREWAMTSVTWQSPIESIGCDTDRDFPVPMATPQHRERSGYFRIDSVFSMWMAA